MVERAIEKEIKKGTIPKYYYKNGKRHKSNPYALARKATGYHGTTHEVELKHLVRGDSVKRGTVRRRL